jgi:hypothetical protein
MLQRRSTVSRRNQTKAGLLENEGSVTDSPVVSIIPLWSLLVHRLDQLEPLPKSR